MVIEGLLLFLPFGLACSLPALVALWIQRRWPQRKVLRILLGSITLFYGFAMASYWQWQTIPTIGAALPLLLGFWQTGSGIAALFAVPPLPSEQEKPEPAAETPQDGDGQVSGP